MNFARVIIALLFLFAAGSAVAATPKVVTSSSTTGSDFSIAVNSNGQVITWGNNQLGQLGNGTLTSKLAPGLVPGLSNVVDVAAGDAHALALKSDGTVWAWGDNQYGQLGKGTYGTGTATPSQIVGLSNIIAVVASGFNNYALRNDGTVFAWGDNYYGQLGKGTYGQTTGSATPTQIAGLQNVTAVTASVGSYGQGYVVAALKNDGTVWVWGDVNNFGQNGSSIPSSSPYQTTPFQVAGVSGVTAVAVGTYYVLALKADGTVWGWGYDSNGSIDGVTGGTFIYTPVQVLTGAKAIAATSPGDSFAVMTNGTVRAWGVDYISPAPGCVVGCQPYSVQLNGLKYINAISGQQTKFAITDYGMVWGWGLNSLGQLGDGSQTDRSTPVHLAGLNGLSALYLMPLSVPSNDLFSNRAALTSNTGTTSFVVTELATKEAGEPNHAGNAGGRSVWWTWTAPSAGQVVLTTDSDFTTALAAYTGTNVAALTYKGSSSSGKLVYQATAGVTYQIAVDGMNGIAGKAKLQWAFNPSAIASLVVSGPPPGNDYSAGTNFNYPVTVLNNGPQAASSVNLTINLPSNVNYVSGPAGCSYSANTVICSIGTIDVGQTITIPIVMNKATSGTISVTSSVTTDTPDQNTASMTFVGNNSVVDPSVDTPTLPEWGVIIMGMLLLGTLVYTDRKNRERNRFF